MRWGLATLALAACTDAPALSSTTHAIEVGAERDVDPPELAVTPYRTSAAFARDGDHYFVAYTDDRESFFSRGDTELAITTIAADGTQLDPHGALVAKFDGDTTVRAACDGAGTCLVAWALFDGTRVLAQRFASGQALDATPLQLDTTSQFPGVDDVAWDGTKFRVAWSVGSGNTQVALSRRVGTTGAPDPVEQLNETGKVRFLSQLACAPPTCIAALLGEDGLFVRRVDPTGATGAEVLIAPATPQRHLVESPHVVAISATTYWLVWAESDINPTVSNESVHAAQFSTQTGTATPPILVTAGETRLTNVGLGFDGTDAIVLYTGASATRASRLAANGTNRDPGGFAVTTTFNGFALQVPCIGTTCYAIWNAPLGARRIANGAVLDTADRTVISATNAEAAAITAAGPGGFLVAWLDTRERGSIRFTQFAAGTQSPTGSTEVAVDPSVFSTGTRVAVARTPASSMIAYSTDSRLDAAWLAADGTVAHGPTPVAESIFSARQPAIATDGTNYLLAHIQRTGNGEVVNARRFAADGTPLDAMPIAIGPADAARLHMSVAFDGTNFVVLEQAERSGETTSDLVATRVSPAGSLVDTTPLPLGSFDFGTEGDSALACQPSGTCLAVFGQGGTQGVRFAAGAVVDATPLDLIPGNVSHPSVTADATRFYVAAIGHAIQIATVDGASGAATPFAQIDFPSAEPGNLPESVAMTPGSDRLLVAYDYLDKTHDYRVRRVRVREVGEHIAPPPPDGADPGDDAPGTDAGGCCQGSAGAAGAWPIVLAVLGAIRGRRRSRLST